MPPHHNGPPHHHGDHGPHHLHFRRNSRYPEHVVGVLGRLLDRAPDFENLDKLQAYVEKKEPGELIHLESAVAELASAEKAGTPKNVLRVMADNKAIEYYLRDKESVLRGLNGNGSATSGDSPEHALVLPVPPHIFHLLEDISPGKLFMLPGHHIPHELDEWDVAELPTRFHEVKAEFAAVQSITFEGFIRGRNDVLTRRDLTDLLSDLAEIKVRPLLRVVSMPHMPHHEKFKPIEDGYQIETLA